MAASINASTTAGVVTTADTSGVLNIQTANTTAISISASQVVSYTNNPTLSAGTANGVLYLNGSKVATSGSALTFDGSALSASGNITSGGVLQALTTVQSSSGADLSLNANGANRDIIYKVNATELMRLVGSTGNLGIGTSSPNSLLTVQNGNILLRSAVTTGALSSYNLGFSATATGGAAAYITSYRENANEASALVFGTWNGSASAERARIDSSGNFLLGCTGNFGAKQNIQFDPASTNGLLFAVSSGTFTNNYIYFQNSGGSKIGSVSSNNSSVTYNTTSDYRIKTNVQPMVGALNNVMQLNPVTYDWKPEFAEGSSQGFIAHELQAIVPQAVTGEKDAVDADGNPVYQGIDTSFLVATLTAAIKEQQALIQTLTARIDALEGAKQ